MQCLGQEGKNINPNMEVDQVARGDILKNPPPSSSTSHKGSRQNFFRPNLDWLEI